MTEKWTKGEDEELRGDYAVAGITIDPHGPGKKDAHCNAIECYGLPLEAAQARRDRILSAINAATADERGETPFVVWSNEHCGWWAPDRCGYTGQLNNAGSYSMKEAMEICYDAGPSSLNLRHARIGIIPSEIMMRLEDARRSTMWHRDNAEIG